jgi:hypothetical protein
MPCEAIELEFSHSIYGLNVRTNHRLPRFSGAPTDSSADLCVWLLPKPSSSEADKHLANQTADESMENALYISPWTGESGLPILMVHQSRKEGNYRLRYDDGTQFFINRAGSEIRAWWPPETSFEDTVTYLAGPVLGFVLHLRGTLNLHASAVDVGGRALVLLGPAGAGKSTTAAAFALRGFPVLTDDLASLNEDEDGFRVQCGYARICLTLDATQSFYGRVDALPAIAPNWEKRSLELEASATRGEARFAGRALPLGAIYVLGDREESGSPHRIEPLSAQEGLRQLLANTYVQYLLTPEQRAREFPIIGRVVAQVPLRKICPANEAERLAELFGLLAEDFVDLQKRETARR